MTQQVKLPIIINGQISPADDVDAYQFQGKSGDEITVEVYARRLNSPLDSLLRLTDASGKVLEWNDDYVAKDMAFLFKDAEGLLTHHADSYLAAKLPADGTYSVQLTDSQHHGGSAYGYPLHLTTKTPDFALRITPSSLSLLPGEVVPITVYVLRKDGFDGEINVSLKGAPSGFKLDGSRIPGGCEHIRMTLRAPKKAPDKPVALKLQGIARVGEKTITHEAVPAEDMMQAFLYRHLVRSQEFLVVLRDARWPVPSVELPNDKPIEIPAGGSVQVHLKSNARQFMKDLHLQLLDPPDGVSLHDVTRGPDGLILTLKADSTVEKGLADNLIIEASKEPAPAGKDAKAVKNRRRRSVRAIPAIPIRVTAPLPKDNEKS
ncbi:MAG: pre-peptidase C-terminal domain-containing protein [Planctomycetes bacterium]|nr:pre-peptidase C-terminal domain-containing protein [Planctomycetota bacterium]